MTAPTFPSPHVCRIDSSNNYLQPCQRFNHCSILEMKVKAQLSVLE
ncbi:hypothetical protein SAMN04490186_4227 [Pseudomonas grimontii]|uniref:Uncharacterized protein n=1 Tax=Pseudomonas grimontii TaxID=129847 RepID=A0ABY0TQX7_9PSED|nr:hypothetical protein SAMN04490186_4227 [Pseudomonas grimontii]